LDSAFASGCPRPQREQRYAELWASGDATAVCTITDTPECGSNRQGGGGVAPCEAAGCGLYAYPSWAELQSMHHWTRAGRRIAAHMALIGRRQWDGPMLPLGPETYVVRSERMAALRVVCHAKDARQGQRFAHAWNVPLQTFTAGAD
jgi:hypothetical protein